ncbi:MAG: peptidylprolyl isomerase [Mariprofundaceae bacterium]|nr:peptidylprolyl isomerase [Mariprofundaceae bacterium]
MKSLIIYGCVLCSFLWSAQAQAERLDAIAAVVNGQAVTCYEVSIAQDALGTQLAQQKGVALPEAQVLYERALESRIMRRLQYQEAGQLEMKVSAAEVDAAIEDVEKRNNLQAGQLTSVLQAQGVDMETYRENLEDRLLNNRLMNVVVRAKLNVSDEAKREYFRKHLKNPKAVREVRIAQLFIALPAEAGAEIVEETRQLTMGFVESIEQGADFSRIVSLKSDAPNASVGGDMGWLSPGAVAGAFTQVFELKVGAITQVIRSASGFHVLKVTDERMRKPQNTQPYDEIHARHILLKIPESADLASQLKIRERAEKIAQEMQGVSDAAFAVRAKELSQGPSASRGGDLGWFKRGQMVPAFEDIAFPMQAGDTSAVVNTQFGLHVIRLVEKRRINPNAYEAHKDKIEQLLMDSEMQQQVPRWMRSIKEKAEIVYRQCQV